MEKDFEPEPQLDDMSVDESFDYSPEYDPEQQHHGDRAIDLHLIQMQAMNGRF